MKPAIGITIGDFNGIGPEVALKAAAHPSVRKLCSPVLIGPLDVFEAMAKRSRVRTKLEKTNLAVFHTSVIAVVDVGDGIEADVKVGAPTVTSGKNAGVAIERAVRLCVDKKLAAFVTAPSSKEGLAAAGYNFPGQTEMIAMLSGSKQVAMMLVSDKIRVGLVTVHTPLKTVASAISIEKVVEKVAIVYRSLQQDFGIKQPRVALLGLNPHAGENGLLGDEEKTLLLPALETLRQQQMGVEGPFPSDGFFGSGSFKKFDAVVALYHDQGLIPMKLLSFETGVNFSAGLPIVRTSPDHGTAYDIAGKNKASAKSTIEAVKLAARIVAARNKA